MKLRITAVCDIGCVRENNEDMVLVGRKLIRDDKLQMSFALNGRHPVFLIAVADGLGGANAGEVASRMVLEHFREHICRLLPGLDREGLKIALSSLALGAHLKLTEEARRPRQKRHGHHPRRASLLPGAPGADKCRR